MTIGRNRLLWIATVWAGAFIILSVLQYNYFQLLNIFGFLTLAFLPGILTVILFRVEGLTFWAYAALAVGFSVLELMLVALIGNTLLPAWGIMHPLSRGPLLSEFGVLITMFVAACWARIEAIRLPLKKYLIFATKRDLYFALIPIIFVTLSVFGAIRINDGASNILTMVMLGGAGVYFVFLFRATKKLGENVIPTALFFIALALLLMTSMRGWYTTGHDIQTEYKVFELTKNAGLWNIAVFRDAYNACLSITILPTIFFNLLKVPDPYIYKIFSQFIFAFAPVLVYLIGRRWTDCTTALLGTIYFIGFPTFFIDMPFLNRQELAFVFFGLMLYTIFEEKLDLSIRRVLFFIFGIGVILSHYSTTYTVLLVLALAIASRPLFLKLAKYLRGKKLFARSSVVHFPRGVSLKPKITVVMVVGLFLVSFLWTQTITNTGSNVLNVLGQTFSAVKSGFGGDNRSIDATSLLSFGKPSQDQELQDYITKVLDPLRAHAPAETYYDPSTYAQYTITALPPENSPLTGAGKFLTDHHIPITSAMVVVGQLLAKLLEVLVPLGVIYLLFKQSIAKYIDPELYLIVFYCLVFILLTIILPVLSVQYGIYRAMQQSMFVIAPIIVAGALAVGDGLRYVFKPLHRYISSEQFAIILGVFFFLYSSHFLPYLFGGSEAVLHLSNTGTYYDDYLIKTTEVYGVDWLTNLVGNNAGNLSGVRLDVQTSRYNKFASLTYIGADTDIMPSAVKKDAYVFLGPVTVQKQRATIIYNADQVNYKYPIQFLDDNKNLIYSNGAAEIYR
ncbi:MAG TPA: DUF2206 domain-containing protein [Candidatus Paceibacterota bacterium]|nr:DUF2206 domain-containing protein [Candidatus Paceibacterota bacterium]